MNNFYPLSSTIEEAEEIVLRVCRRAESRCSYFEHPLWRATEQFEEAVAIIEHGRECVLRALARNSDDKDTALLRNFARQLTQGSDYVELTFLTDSNVPWLKNLLSYGVDLRRALHAAVYASYEPAVRALLDVGADPNEVDFMGRTPLHAATWCSTIHIVRLLLDRGAKVDAIESTHERFTPLIHAAGRCNREMMRLLLDRGANINRANNYIGMTVLRMAIFTDAPTDWLEELLRRGADIELRHEATGKTPLMAAAECGNLSATRILLSARADVAATDNLSRTALMYASKSACHMIVRELLLSAETTGRAIIDIEDVLLQTALDYVLSGARWSAPRIQKAEFGKTMYLLLSYGAKVKTSTLHESLKKIDSDVYAQFFPEH